MKNCEMSRKGNQFAIFLAGQPITNFMPFSDLIHYAEAHKWVIPAKYWDAEDGEYSYLTTSKA